MNKTNRIILAAICVALAGGGFLPGIAFGAGKAAPAPAQQTQDMGKLVIVRSANLGQTVVEVSIDGAQKARLSFGGHYETPLAVGPHVVTTLPMPNREHAQPSQTRINVQRGKTYTFTAVRSDVAIVLK